MSTPDWAIRYLVVDTKNWWPGKHVLVVPQWTSDISWSERAVTLEMTREQIEKAPDYDPRSPSTGHSSSGCSSIMAVRAIGGEWSYTLSRSYNAQRNHSAFPT
jgi:hypothetical protein